MKKIVALVMVIIGLNACEQPEKKENYLAADRVETSRENHPGKALLDSKCAVCHSPTATMDNRLAPPMQAVKMHYLGSETSKEDFKSAIWEFVKEPTLEKSQMPGAVRKFNLMPKQAFSEEDIRLIADYMFDNELNQPEWFKDHQKQGCQNKRL